MKPITILVCALGGEGGGVLAEWLVDTAIACGHAVQSTSIPGVAQRTGATTYYIEVFATPDAELGGRRPVFSLTPVPGALDLLVSSELLETARQVANGMTARERTRIVSSSARVLTTAEKMQLADGRADPAALQRVVRTQALQAEFIDMAELARAHGTVVSAVLFGAIAASGVLPFPLDAYRDAIRAAGKGAEASVRGFDAAVAALRAAQAEPVLGDPARVEGARVASMDARSDGRLHVRSDAAPDARPDAAPDAATRASSARADNAAPPWADLPAEAHAIVALGHARVAEYQDARYADLYLQRVRRIADAEAHGDPARLNAHATLREAARHLAVWMAYDDIVRVAELKSRASRSARVRAEVRAAPADLLRVREHFKPGVAEFAGLLPPLAAAALQRWDARRVARGREPFALPLKLPTHTIAGAFALRALAALKRWRPHGSRHAQEQALIERWLAAVEAGARHDAALGRELAECGRLIKGYGATNERGKLNLLHVVEHLASPQRLAAAQAGTAATSIAAITAAVAAARRAALADDAGRALDAALVQHGAPPRPLREQPMRWVTRRPGGRAGAAKSHAHEDAAA